MLPTPIGVGASKVPKAKSPSASAGGPGELEQRLR